MNVLKLTGEWKGKLTIYGVPKERKIQIFKVKNQKNKIVFPGFKGPEEGTLLAAKRKKPTLLGGPNGNLEFVFVTYSARGSYQDGPMHTYNKHVAFASKDEKVLESLMKFLQKHITKGKVRRTIKRGGGKKRTVKKSKKKRNSNSAYFEFDRFLGKGKFWRIVKNGSKITTHYGKIGTLGQMNTKDYGSKVDKKFDSLLKSKKDKGYVEKEYYGHVSESNPKPPTKVEREYLRICKKAEQNKKINPMMRNLGCEDLLDQGESELKWQTQWNKDALKKGEFDWTSYEEHSKSKRTQ
jgi:predicted DNA-binding WGR domain protein